MLFAPSSRNPLDFNRKRPAGRIFAESRFTPEPCLLLAEKGQCDVIFKVFYERSVKIK
jgi:hypothetical protein